MSIWTIQETENSIIFVEHENRFYQCWELLEQMSHDYNNCPVQIPFIGCYNGYENCLIWNKNYRLN